MLWFILTCLQTFLYSDESPLIIMEYLPNGNLLSHLRSSRQRIEDFEMHRTSMRTTLSPTDLIRYAYEIANGMAYLSSTAVEVDEAVEEAVAEVEEEAVAAEEAEEEEVVIQPK